MRALVLSGGAGYGAFQAGAIEALYRLGWVPDVILGTSVGALNGAAIAAGMTPRSLCTMWRAVKNQDVYRTRPFRTWLQCWKWDYLLDTEPLKAFVKSHIDFNALEASETGAFVFSTNALTGKLTTYTNWESYTNLAFVAKYSPKPLGPSSVLASSAIPLIFPMIRGEWDGAILQYAPIMPAVDLGATEIVVVTAQQLNTSGELPTGLVPTLMHLIDFHITSVSKDMLKVIALNSKNNPHVDVKVIAPTLDFGYSKLDFSSPKKVLAISHGKLRTRAVMYGRG